MRIGNLAILVLVGSIGCGGTPPPSPPPAQPAGDHSSALERDDRIEAGVRNELRARNGRVLEALRSNDSATLRELFSAELLADMERGNGLEASVAPLREAMQQASFEPLHDYHIPLSAGQTAAVDAVAEPEGWRIMLEPRGTAMFVSLFQMRQGFRDRMLGLVWSSEDQGWRLSGLRAGTLRISGRTAQEWYDEAKALQADGLSFPASKRLSLAADLLRPVAFLQYTAEDEIVALQQRVNGELATAFSFPWELSDLEGNPTVYRIRPLFLEQQLSHAVQYVTRLPLVEGTLEPEVDRLHAELVRRIPGFCDSVDNVAYSAFAEAPLEAGRNYRSVGIVAHCGS